MIANRILARSIAVSLGLSLAGPSISTYATDYTWDGGGGDDLWGTAANWNPDGAPFPSSSNSLIFAGTMRLTPVNNYANGDDFQNITFATGAGAFTISNTGTNGIDWFGSITNSSSNTQTIGFRLYQKATNTIIATSGNVALNSSALIFRDNQALSFTAAAGMGINIDSVVADGGGGAGTPIEVNGAGTVTLTGANTFTSGTRLSSSGTILVGNNSALGTGGLNLTGTGSLGASAAGITLGSGNAITMSGGSLTLTGSNALTINGTVTASGASRSINNTITSGTTVLAGNIYLSESDSVSRGLTFGSSATVSAGTTTLVSGGIANNSGANTLAANLKVGGGGKVILTGVNTYTGTTTVENTGTILQVGNGGTTGNLGSGNVTVTTGNLAFNRSDSLTVGNIISGTGSLSQVGAGVTVITGANTYTGATTVSGGTLKVDNNGTSTLGKITGSSAAASIAVNTGGTLLLAGSGTADRISNLAGITLGGGAFSIAAGSREGAAATVTGGTVSGTSAGGLGALTLSGSSTLDFDSLGSGTLMVFGSFSPGAFTLNISGYSNSNYDGSLNSGLAADDRLVFHASLTPSQLAAINFGSGFTTTQMQLDSGFYEVGFTAVPEAGTLFGAGALLGLAGARRRRPR